MFLKVFLEDAWSEWRLPRTEAQRNTAQYCMEISLKQMRGDEEAEWLPGVGTHAAMAMRKLLGFISSASVYSKIQTFFSFSLCGPIQHPLKSVGGLPMSLKSIEANFWETFSFRE